MYQRTQGSSPKPMTVLSALLRGPEDVERLDLRLKISREEKTLGIFLVKHRRDLVKGHDENDSLKPFTDFITDVSKPTGCEKVECDINTQYNTCTILTDGENDRFQDFFCQAGSSSHQTFLHCTICSE